jgi:hypothetical protein
MSAMPLRRRITTWLGSAVMVFAAAYIMLGGNPPISAAIVNQHIERLNQAAATVEFTDMSGLLFEAGDVSIVGWAYDQLAQLEKPSVRWRSGGSDWQLRAASVMIKQDKVNPKRLKISVTAPLTLLRNGQVATEFRFSDGMMLVVNDTGEGSLRVVESQLQLPRDIAWIRPAAKALTLSFPESARLQAIWSPENSKLILTASAPQMDVIGEESTHLAELQLSLLDNRAADGSRLGHVTLAARVDKQGDSPFDELAATAEYRADSAYRRAEIKLVRAAIGREDKVQNYTGAIHYKYGEPLVAELEQDAQKKTVSALPLNDILTLFR